MSDKKSTVEMIEEWAELQLSVEDIFFALGLIDDKAVLCDPSHEWTQALRRGRLKAEASIRKSLYIQASQGSSPAQKQFLEFVKQCRRQDETFMAGIYADQRRAASKNDDDDSPDPT
jgi:hypothetical protein